MLLAFPHMHPELSDYDTPELQFFDPGMADEVGERMFRPEGLPMDKRTATALINDCIRFGEQFKDPSEMAYFGAMTSDEFYEGSSMSIQAQLSRQFDDGQGTKKEREQREAATRAQFILLLAWFFEEKSIELRTIEQGVKNSWKAMDETLGMDDEDRVDGRVLDISHAASHTGGASDGQSVPLPWQRVIEALPAFIPEGTVLLCANSSVIEFWDDREIEFKPADDSLGLPAGAMTAKLPAWQLAGRRKVPAEFPLSAREVSVVILRQAEES